MSFFFLHFGMIPMTNSRRAAFFALQASAKRRDSAIESAAAQKRIAQMQEGGPLMAGWAHWIWEIYGIRLG